jgi:ABC-type branched-subunit amino acid transport system ATPase component
MNILNVIGVNKSFGGLKVVNDLSFDVGRGEITVLTGINGSGKSTVFNLISGILNPDSGKIIFDGVDITNLPIEKISNIGILRAFQHPRLFNNLTVKENLLLSLDSNDTKFWKNLIGYKIGEEKITSALNLIEMETFKEKTARCLSYGQKRLVELGRAVIGQYKFLMLDEPASGLSPKLKEKIGELILFLKKEGKTIFFIEHDMDFALKIADTVILIDEGKQVSAGINEKIRTQLI